MSRLLWDDTIPFHDTVPVVPLRVKLDRAEAYDRSEKRRRGDEWKQSQFDGRGEWSLLGLELLALSAVVVISLVAWLT